MHKWTKFLIENNINLIEEGRFIELYETLNQLHWINNKWINDIYEILLEAGIDSSNQRQSLLEKVCKEICQVAIQDGNDSIQSVIKNTVTRLYGYDISQVVKHIKQNQDSLGISLKAAPSTYWEGIENYYIYGV